MTKEQKIQKSFETEVIDNIMRGNICRAKALCDGWNYAMRASTPEDEWRVAYEVKWSYDIKYHLVRCERQSPMQRNEHIVEGAYTLQRKERD